MPVTIENKQPRMLVLPKGTRLLPGQKTEVADDVYADAKGSEAFLMWAKLGYIKIHQARTFPVEHLDGRKGTASVDPGAVPAPPHPAGHPIGLPEIPVEHPLAGKLSLLGAQDAIREVKKTDDMALLLIWQRTEARKGVGAELDKRILQLQEEGPTDADSPEDGASE